MLHVSLLPMKRLAQMWEVDGRDSYCFRLQCPHDNSCGVEVWASSRRIHYDMVKLCLQMCMALLSVVCVGFPLCNRDWFQNSSSKPSGPLLCSLDTRWKISWRCFILSSELRKSFTLSLSLSVLISLWKQMIYVQSSHSSLCVILIRPVGLCACSCLCGLWVFIETADCRTAYWRTQTIFRGNVKSHQFPIPFLISSIPIWLMYIILLNQYHLTTAHWPYANATHLSACCKVG